jgi:hypothetical protein
MPYESVAADQRVQMNDNAEISDAQLGELFAKPDLFLWQFDGAQALFVNMDRNAYHRSIFCDQRIVATRQQILRIETARLYDLLPERQPAESQPNYIFHIAHCGSTLLARALDIKDKNIVYREPAVLRQLGVEAAFTFRDTKRPAQWQRKLDLSLALLNRSYAQDTPIIIKANVPVNFMIDDIFGSGGCKRAILLYLGLEDYLLAVLKSPNHRAWVASIVTELANAIEGIVGLTAEERRGLSIAEMAACLWMAQITIFERIMTTYSNVKTLDAELFYNDPRNALRRSFEFFRQPVDASSIAGIVSSELFTRYSKDPRHAFDNRARLAQREQTRAQLAGDIEKARAWIGRHGGQAAPPSRLCEGLI